MSPSSWSAVGTRDFLQNLSQADGMGGGGRSGELALLFVGEWRLISFSLQKQNGISPPRMDVKKPFKYCSPLSDP